jgi:Homeodomain-like domain-containing protein/LAGLIDADG DNA endonuclease family protein
MHPPQVRASILTLVDAGLNDCEISRRTGINRRTVCDIRSYREGPRRRNGALAALTETCPRCWRWAKPMRFTHDDYAELLALYLGDGCISEGARTMRLRIVLDAKYPGIISDARELLQRCFPLNDVHVGKGPSGNCLSVSVYSTHLGCLFPQHGRGLKHARRIVLEPWQREIIDAAQWAFLRGCIRSDGCVFINRTGPYEYLSYDFSNFSEDIARLFTGVCDDLGLRPRLNCNRHGRWDVRINRRESVALLLEYVGRKT